jgi:hypothetical protein
LLCLLASTVTDRNTTIRGVSSGFLAMIANRSRMPVYSDGADLDVRIQVNAREGLGGFVPGLQRRAWMVRAY